MEEGKQKEGGRDSNVGISHSKVLSTLRSPFTQQQLLLSLTNDTQAQRKRGKELLTPEPSFSYHPSVLEGGQARKQGTQRVPASLKDI